MDSKIKERFKELKVIGQRSALSEEEKTPKDKMLISYLKSVLDSEDVTDFHDIGFCYWNLSDNYGFMRDGHSLLTNHQMFYDHVKTEHPCYLYWLVNDGTQRFTLEKDGYSEYWWGLYQNAVLRNANNDLHFAEFHVHRTALSINPDFPHIKEYLDFSKNAFENFLDNTAAKDEYSFYYIIYLSLVSRIYSSDTKELKSLCERLFKGLSKTDSAKKFLVGEWESFVSPFGEHKRSVVGIISAINSLIYNGELKTANELYRNARSMGLPKNFYVEKRLTI